MTRSPRPASRRARRSPAAPPDDIRSNPPLGPRGRRPAVKPLQRRPGGTYETGVQKPSDDPWVDEGTPEING